ncbi:MAG: tetratricopeptide repeat protein [Campylobacterota bacterium]|nr:tetratricopeptide repeat protein [Campylobacterota bacterium]
MEKNKSNLESYLTLDDKLKLKNLNTSYHIKKSGSYLSLIGVNSISLLNEFKSYLLNIENTVILNYQNISILDEITNYDKTYIIDLYTKNSNFTIKEIVQYFRFNRDFIPQNNIKLFILASFETLDLFSQIAYDFVTFNSFYGKFNDNSVSLNYNIDDSKLNRLISEFKNIKPNTPKKIQIDKMIAISKEAHHISSKNIELKYLQLALKKALKLKDDYLLGTIYNALGNYYTTANFKLSISNYKNALKIADKIKNKDARIKTLNNLGIIYFNNFNIEEAESNFKQAKKASEDTQNTKEKGSSYRNLSSILIFKNDFKEAIKLLDKSLSIAKELDHKKEITLSLSVLGKLYFTMLNYNKAINYFEQSLVLDKEINNTDYIITTSYNLALVHKELLNFDISSKYLNEILMIADTLDNQYMLPDVYSLIAELNIINLEFEEANQNIYKSTKLTNKVEILLKSLMIYRYTDFYKYENSLRKFKNLDSHKIFLYEKGHYNFQIKNYDLAIEYFTKSLNLSKEDKDKKYIVLCLINIANTYIILENYYEAKNYLDLASKEVEQIDDKSSKVELYMVYYNYYLHTKDTIKSKEYYNKANYIIKNSNHKLYAKKLNDINAQLTSS